MPPGPIRAATFDFCAGRTHRVLADEHLGPDRGGKPLQAVQDRMIGIQVVADAALAPHDQVGAWLAGWPEQS